MRDDDENGNLNNPWPRSERSRPQPRSPEKDQSTKLWGALLFGFIGATITTFAVGQLRRTAAWFYFQHTRSHPSQKGANGRTFRSYFEEEAWKKYNRRMQEEYEEEMERVERINRMQRVFNREKSKYTRGRQRWEAESDGAYHQHFQRDDWYWKTNTSHRKWKTDSRETIRNSSTYPLSHHYSILGLDRSRVKPYTEVEIKTAFRTKAKEFHPDQNQDNKESAEAKFKEVLKSYEAIKSERKDMK